MIWILFASQKLSFNSRPFNHVWALASDVKLKLLPKSFTFGPSHEIYYNMVLTKKVVDYFAGCRLFKRECEYLSEHLLSVFLYSGSLTARYIPEAKGLKIVNASKTDSGIFTCRALQVGKEDGFVESVDITFKVQRKYNSYSLYNSFHVWQHFQICLSPL